MSSENIPISSEKPDRFPKFSQGEPSETQTPTQLSLFSVENETLKQSLNLVDPTLANMVNKWLAVLTLRQHQILRLRYGLDAKALTLEQVGDQINLTRERVRQLQKKGLNTLKKRSNYRKIEHLYNFVYKTFEGAYGLQNEKQLITSLKENIEIGEINPGAALQLVLDIKKEIIWSSKAKVWVIGKDLAREVENVQKRLLKILEKNHIAAQVFRYLLHALDIAKKAQPGQFVIIRLDETGERIPITISDADPTSGTLTLYVQAVGKTSLEMSQMKVDDFILDIVGPLGNPSEIDRFGTVVLVGGGFGIAAIHPIARALTQAGNKTISILGVRTKELLILEKEMLKVSNEVHVVTDDGSYGEKGMVTNSLQMMIDEKEFEIKNKNEKEKIRSTCFRDSYH